MESTGYRIALGIVASHPNWADELIAQVARCSVETVKRAREALESPQEVTA